MTFTGPDAIAAARAAGFSDAEALTAAAIALAESGGNEKATHTNTNGTVDYGAWQINSVHKDILARGDKFNLKDNAKMAYAVYKSQGFKAWVTYKSGAYKKHDIGMALSGLTDPATGKPKTNDQLAADIDAQGSPLENAVKSATGIDGLSAALAKVGSDVTTVIIVVVLLVLGVLLVARNTAPVRGALGLASLAGPGGKVKLVSKVLAP